MMPASASCPTCRAPLRADGVCLACAFQDALAAPGGSVASDTVVLPPARETPFAALNPKAPERIREYVLQREIARGGMGIVYEVEDTKLRRTVALKMVRGFAFAAAEDLVRFRAEAETAAALDHPNIVPIYDVGEHDGQPYFTMKLIAGESLAVRLRAGPLTPVAAATLMVKIAEAVQHAHSRGVLHRDLKPANILIDQAGEPWLTDFGLAKFADVDSGVTVTHSHLGTPQYMSPEQAAGKSRDISTASDVWSLGVMLYQMVSGRLPFTGENNTEVMRRIVQSEPEPLSGTGSRFKGDSKAPTANLEVRNRRDLITIVSRCLEKDPGRRLPGAGFLAGELKSWLAGEPIRSRPVTSAERVWKWMQRHPYRVAGMGVVGLSLLVGGAAALLGWRGAEQARAVADQNAAAARDARDKATETSYYATVANALGERQHFNFASARQLLASVEPSRRGFEWRLVNGLTRGDDIWTTSFNQAVPKCLALDSAAGRVVVLTGDRKLHQVDIATGQTRVIGEVPAVPAKLHARERSYGFRKLAFAPDGKNYFVVEGDVLMAVTTADHRLRYSAEETSLEAGWESSRTILHSGSSHFALKDGPNAMRFDVETGVATPVDRYDVLGPFVVSPDGSRIACAAGDENRIEVYRTTDRFQAAPLNAFAGTPRAWVHDIAFSPDGKYVAAAYRSLNNAEIWVFGLQNGATVFHQQLASAPSIAFEQTDAVLLSAGREPWAQTWRYLKSQAAADTFDDGALQGNDPFVAGGPLGPPQRLLTRSAQAGRVGFLFGHEAAARSVLALPKTDGFLTASDDGTVRRWPASSRLPAHQRLPEVRTLHTWFHPTASHDGARVVYRGSNAVSYVWQRLDGPRIEFPEGCGGVAVFNDGRVLARHRETGDVVCLATTNGTMTELWRTSAGPEISGFHQIIHTAVSRDEQRVAVLQPGKLLVVDCAKRVTHDTPNQQMTYGNAFCQSIDLSPDGKTVAVTGFAGRRVRLYSADNPAAGHATLTPAEDLTSHDSACAFSRDGARLYVANEDGWVRVFDVATRQELTAERWKAHTTEITAIAVSQTGDIVATAAQGGMALWSTSRVAGQPRRERLRPALDAARNWIQFCGDDSVLMHSAPDQALEAWEAPR